MPDATVIARIRDKYFKLASELDERGRRRWAAVEATSLGRGGITAVANATGISDRTIRTGISELNSRIDLPPDRQRCRGGRKSFEVLQPKLRAALDQLIDPTIRRCVAIR